MCRAILLLEDPDIAEHCLSPTCAIIAYEEAQQTGGVECIGKVSNNELLVDIEAEMCACGYNQKGIKVSITTEYSAGPRPVNQR